MGGFWSQLKAQLFLLEYVFLPSLPISFLLPYCDKQSYSLPKINTLTSVVTANLIFGKGTLAIQQIRKFCFEWRWRWYCKSVKWWKRKTSVSTLLVLLGSGVNSSIVKRLQPNFRNCIECLLFKHHHTVLFKAVLSGSHLQYICFC